MQKRTAKPFTGCALRSGALGWPFLCLGPVGAPGRLVFWPSRWYLRRYIWQLVQQVGAGSSGRVLWPYPLVGIAASPIRALTAGGRVVGCHWAILSILPSIVRMEYLSSKQSLTLGSSRMPGQWDCGVSAYYHRLALVLASGIIGLPHVRHLPERVNHGKAGKKAKRRSVPIGASGQLSAHVSTRGNDGKKSVPRWWSENDPAKRAGPCQAISRNPRAQSVPVVLRRVSRNPLKSRQRFRLQGLPFQSLTFLQMSKAVKAPEGP